MNNHGVAQEMAERNKKTVSKKKQKSEEISILYTYKRQSVSKKQNDSAFHHRLFTGVQQSSEKQAKH